MKKIFVLIYVIATSLAITAQTPEQIARIDEIKSQDTKYYFAESTSLLSASDAFNNALQDMARQVSASISVDIKESGNEYDAEAIIKSAASFNNVGKIEFTKTNSGETNYTAFVYISRAEYDKQLNETRNQALKRIESLIEEGIYQEGKVNIADALRNFNWALQLCAYHNYNEKLDVTDNRQVTIWLDDKIKSILESLQVTLADEKVEYDPMDYDHYTVNMMVTYGDRPVSNLDIIYFNNQENREVSVKNGRAALKYPNLTGQKNITFNVRYSYDDADEIEEDLQKAYKMGKKKSYDKLNKKTLPVDVNKDQTRIKTDSKGDWEVINYEIAQRSDGIPPRVEEKFDEVERVFLNDKSEIEDLVKIATELEMALRNRQYESVYQHFTPEALKKFQMMTNTGEISVSMLPQYKFEKASHYIRCTSIPVSIKNGKHSRNENMVLRFDPQTRKISSLGYALTENAENDIFRSSDWQLDSRYAIVKFMEDYQTAYTTKDKEYLEPVFNGKAIIITGTVPKGKNEKNYMQDLASNNTSLYVSGILYEKFTKDQFLENLDLLFKRNKYIHLKYHDAELSRAVTPPYMSEAFWIELKQDFNSSNYNDKGYLTLLVGMKPEGSQIYVRTWTPNHMSLSEMKKKFPLDKFE